MSSSSKIAIWTLLIVCFLVIISKILDANNSQVISFDFKGAKNWSFEFEDSNLNRLIKDTIAKSPATGEYAIVVESLTKADKATINEDEKFPAASLYKLFLLSAVYEELEKGELKKEDKITTDIKHLEEVLGGKEFGYEDYTDEKLTYSIEDILSRITRISDNYASIMLAEKLTWNKVQAQADKIGASATTIKSPITTTAQDIALFYRKLYQGEIVSKKASEEIINLLASAEINNRIPAELPKEIEVKEGSKSATLKLKIAHKTGELLRVRHDAGIVLYPQNPYIIVLLSKDLKDEDQTVELQSQLSKKIFDHFTQ